MESNEVMNLALCVESVGVGEVENFDHAAWELYFQGLRDRSVGSWNGARNAYLTLKQVRESLGLPFIKPPGEAGLGMPDALSDQENEMFFQLSDVATKLAEIGDDIAAGRRKVVWVDSLGDLGVERLPTDTVRVRIDAATGRVVLVDLSTNQPVPSSGTVSLGPLVWVGFAGATIAAIAAVYFTNVDNNETARVLAEQKTYRSLSNAAKAAVDAGATPEQAAKIPAAILKGAAELKKVEAEVEKEKRKSAVPETVTTVAYIGLAIAGIFLLAKVIPAFTAGKVEAA